MKPGNQLILLFFPALLMGFAFSCAKDKGKLPVTTASPEQCSTVSYVNEIKPLLDARCMSCHAGNSYADGNFTTYEGLKEAIDNGKLYKAVITNKTMPVYNTLTDAELKKFKCWLENGANKD